MKELKNPSDRKYLILSKNAEVMKTIRAENVTCIYFKFFKLRYNCAMFHHCRSYDTNFTRKTNSQTAPYRTRPRTRKGPVQSHPVSAIGV